MNEYNPFSLKGKTILVTGASSGIGRATAVECSRMGARVIISARNEQRLKETLDKLDGKERGHEMITADLTDAGQMEHLIGSLPELDGVVVCAGIGHRSPVKMTKPEDIRRLFDTNFFASEELVRLLFKKKLLAREASVVILASVAGNYILEPGNMAYGTTKAAINAFMKFAAKEFAPRLVRVNSICPGMVETPLIGHDKVEQQAYIEAKYPLKRFGRPEEVAYTAVYLLSDATKWMTGSSILIDGGSTLV